MTAPSTTQGLALDLGKPLTAAEVSARTGIAVSTLHNWARNNTGPRSAKLGRRVVWFENDLNAWIEERPRSSHLANRRGWSVFPLGVAVS
jgi:predicted DNA-binding transcriptional regulator AlpA